MLYLDKILFRFFLIKEYLLYYLAITSKTKYFIHSPFLYNLIEKVFFRKEKKIFPIEENIEFKKIKKELLKNNQVIDVQDFGQGSKLNKNSLRKIKDIYKHSTTSQKKARLLYSICEYFKCQNILEIGTSLGITTAYLASCPNTKVWSLEGDSFLYKTAKENLKRLSLDNVKIIKGNFKYTLENTLQEIKKVDLIYLDGNHSKEHTLDYFKKIKKNTHEKTVFILDDIRWSKDMLESWKEIKKKEEIKLSLDLFFQGILFFDTKLTKQNIILRII